MNTITIPKNITGGEELVIIPREKYDEFLHLRQIVKNEDIEDSDTDLALKVYQEEKRGRKLQTINSLADLD